MHACYIIPEWLQRAKETRHFREILEAKARNPWKCKGDLLDVRQESKEPSCRRGWEAVGCWPWSLAAGFQWSCSSEARKARPGLGRWPAEQMSRQQVQMGEQIDRQMTIPVGGISSGDPVKLRALGSEEFTGLSVPWPHRRWSDGWVTITELEVHLFLGSIRGGYIIPWSGVSYNFLALVFLLWF